VRYKRGPCLKYRITVMSYILVESHVDDGGNGCRVAGIV